MSNPHAGIPVHDGLEELMPKVKYDRKKVLRFLNELLESAASSEEDKLNVALDLFIVALFDNQINQTFLPTTGSVNGAVLFHLTQNSWMLHLCDGISARMDDAERWDRHQ